MKDTTRQPTSLRELDQLINSLRDEEAEALDNFPESNEEILRSDKSKELRWLEWTYNFLTARRLYHKKRLVKQQMLEKMAKTLLSRDELEAIDREAEKQLGNLDDDAEPEATEHEHVAD